MVALRGKDIDAFLARPDAGRPIILLYGPDAGLVRERADALIASAVDDPNDPFSLVRLDGDASENFSASKLFTGCLGINRLGVMETDPLIARAQTRLLKRADKVIVMADASKLRKRSSMIVCGLDRVAVLVTDNGAAAADLEVYRSAGIEVIVASVLVEDGLTKSA